jgi:hypothetical protein
LVAGLEDQVAGLPIDNFFAELGTDAAFQHDAVLVLAAVAVERRRQRARRPRMLTSENRPPESSPPTMNRTPIAASLPTFPSIRLRTLAAVVACISSSFR